MAAAVSLHAQTQQDVNAHGWYMYFGDHAVSERWELHLEGQWRRHDVITQWQQLLLRPGMNYKVNDWFSVAFGYTYFRNYPYGNFPSDALETEHRAYEDVKVSHTWGRADVLHRVRLEQRFARPREPGRLQATEWEYRNRVRYRWEGQIPLRAASVDESRFYLSLYDEVFVNWGAHGGAQALDQNRAYAAMGVRLPVPNTFLEVGYLHQFLPQDSGLVSEHNHTLQLSVQSSFSFRKQRR